MKPIHQLTDQESTAFYCLKAFAILSVISAHVVTLSQGPFLQNMISSFGVLFGTVGVICFFVSGGFFYRKPDGDRKSYWINKLKTLVLPWVICATLTYLLAILAGKPFSLSGYCKWVLGNGSWYYYITVYLLFLFVFQYIYQHDSVLYTLVFLTPAALLLKTLGFQLEDGSFFTSYLNPLYWVGFFSAGILMRKKRWDRTIITGKLYVTCAFLVMLASAAFLYSQRIFTYFHIVSAIFELSAFVVLLRLSFWITQFRISSVLRNIGTSSYCIYLLHMQIVQAIDNRMPDHILTDLLSPLVGLLAMQSLINIGTLVCKRLPFGQTIRKLMGLR